MKKGGILKANISVESEKDMQIFLLLGSLKVLHKNCSKHGHLYWIQKD